jgi:non-canonical poly(A) RNA polymerase PAPD5/7
MNSYRPSYDNRRGGGRRGGRGQSHHSLAPRPPQGRDYHRPHSPNRQYDSNRNGYDDRRGPPPRFDNHRPPQGDFTFRMDGPPGLGNADNYRSGAPNQGRRGNYRGRGGRGRQPYARVLPADRKLLQEHEEVREALVDEENAITYRNIDELSDDEEAEMDFSEQSGDEEGQPASKRARHSAPDTAAAQSAPKWSNPDADTALPPIEDNQRKKKDVVKMIRKARNEDNSAARLNASTEAEDFISFDFGDDDAAEDDDDADAGEAAEDASRGSPEAASRHAEHPEAPRGPAHDARPAPPAQHRDESRHAKDDGPLGSRKRTHDDEIKPPAYGPLKKNMRTPARGKIVGEWAPRRGEDPCPWLYKDHSKSSTLSVW